MQAADVKEESEKQNRHVRLRDKKARESRSSSAAFAVLFTSSF
jgi:hypothetical protein